MAAIATRCGGIVGARPRWFNCRDCTADSCARWQQLDSVAPIASCGCGAGRCVSVSRAWRELWPGIRCAESSGGQRPAAGRSMWRRSRDYAVPGERPAARCGGGGWQRRRRARSRSGGHEPAGAAAADDAVRLETAGGARSAGPALPRSRGGAQAAHQPLATVAGRPSRRAHSAASRQGRATVRHVDRGKGEGGRGGRRGGGVRSVGVDGGGWLASDGTACFRLRRLADRRSQRELRTLAEGGDDGGLTFPGRRATDAASRRGAPRCTEPPQCAPAPAAGRHLPAGRRRLFGLQPCATAAAARRRARCSGAPSTRSR